MYSGQKVKPKGKLMCAIEIDNHVLYNLSLIIIDNTFSHSLLGRASGICFSRLDIVDNVRGGTPNTWEGAIGELKKLFPNDFESKVGTFNKGSIKLEVEEGATPRAWLRTRPVPHALPMLVAAELERLQREGIVSPVEWGEWGTPVVSVIKKTARYSCAVTLKLLLIPFL